MKLKFLLLSWVSLTATLATVAIAQAGLLKASPAPPSDFLEHPQRMGTDPERTPFDKVWRNPSPRAWERVQGYDRVVIAPVNTAYLKAHPLQREDVEKMAAYMRSQFQQEFARGGHYRVMQQPGLKTLVLELALVQFRPTNVPGNVLSTGAGVVVPGANLVGSQLTHGNIAFEAKLRNGANGELLAEYADRESDKLSLLSFRDYSQYAHARRAVQDWAHEMRVLATTPRNQKVSGAMRVTLNPF